MSSVSPQTPSASASPPPDPSTESSLSSSSAGTSAGTQEKSSWQVFTATFATIFLAEVGDKTQVTTLLMSAESHRPWIVFAGAGLALVFTSLLGVLLGRWLASRLSQKTLERGAGITLLAIAIWLGLDIVTTLRP